MNKKKTFKAYFTFNDCCFSDYDNVFMKAVSTMRTFKVVNLKHRIALNNMQMQAPSKDIFPPLHCEVFEHGDCSTEDSKKSWKNSTEFKIQPDNRVTGWSGYIDINVCKYGSITVIRQWKISDSQVIQREEGKVTKISVCVIQTCWSSLTLNSADMASDAAVIICLFYETGAPWFPRTPPCDEVVDGAPSHHSDQTVTEPDNDELVLLQIVPSNSHFSNTLQQCVYRLKWQFFYVMLAESSWHCNAHCVPWVFSLTVHARVFCKIWGDWDISLCYTWSILVLSRDFRWVSMCGTCPFLCQIFIMIVCEIVVFLIIGSQYFYTLYLTVNQKLFISLHFGKR